MIATEFLNDQFYRTPKTYRQRIERKAMKALLLHGEPIIALGELWVIKHKHLGLGVYEIWLELKNPKF